MVSGGCLEGVWKESGRQGMPRGWQENVLKVSGGCLNVIGRCLQDVWNVFDFFGSQKVGKRVSTGRLKCVWKV